LDSEEDEACLAVSMVAKERYFEGGKGTVVGEDLVVYRN
jgi:hypothetical protein